MLDEDKKLLERWDPIFYSLKVKDERVKLFMAHYADYHSSLEIENTKIFSDSNMNYTNLLPISLRVLSRLNLANKNLYIRKNLPNSMFENEVEVKNEEIKDDDIIYSSKRETLKVIQTTEEKLVQQLVDYINYKLETSNDFYVTQMVNSMGILTENSGKPKMVLMSRFNVGN